MDEELYRIDEIKMELRKWNPHLEIKEYRKNPSSFTVDFILCLAGQETRVEVPMDLFRDYDCGGKEQAEERLQEGYVLLLRKLEKK